MAEPTKTIQVDDGEIRLKVPVRFIIDILPQPDSDAIINTQMSVGSKEQIMTPEMAYYIFYKIFMTLAKGVAKDTKDSEFEKYVAGVRQFLLKQEPKVAQLKKMKNIFKH